MRVFVFLLKDLPRIDIQRECMRAYTVCTDIFVHGVRLDRLQSVALRGTKRGPGSTHWQHQTIKLTPPEPSHNCAPPERSTKRAEQ